MKHAFLVVVALAACKSSSPPPVGPPQPTGGAPATGVTITPIEDENGNTYQISQGVKGEPKVVGCADGQREAFVDAAAHPTIAGCIGEWDGNANMRAARTGAACGDDGSRCAVPADVCAEGWRVCGETGAIADLFGRVNAEQCENAGGGRFVAALSHCKTQEGCQYEDPSSGNYACFNEGWCSEPVCCGNDCGELGACPSGVWPEKTHIPVGTDQGCGSIGSSRARGVLCCRS